MILVGPKCNHKSPYKKEADGDLAHRDLSGVAASLRMLAAIRSWERQGTGSRRVSIGGVALLLL